MSPRHFLDEPITLECLECTCVFSLPERVLLEQEKIFYPKCGKCNNTKATIG